MTVTIQINTPEDFKLMEPLLRLIREQGGAIQVSTDSLAKSENPEKKSKGLAERLHGIVNLPNSFDYKTFMAAELLKKHVLSICNIAYILRKLSPDIDIPTVLTDLSALTTLTPTENLVISAALKSTCKDFEDALQHFSALQYNGMTHIPTRNPNDFILSKIPVFTPKKYLESKKH